MARGQRAGSGVGGEREAGWHWAGSDLAPAPAAMPGAQHLKHAVKAAEAPSHGDQSIPWNDRQQVGAGPLNKLQVRHWHDRRRLGFVEHLADVAQGVVLVDVAWQEGAPVRAAPHCAGVEGEDEELGSRRSSSGSGGAGPACRGCRRRIGSAAGTCPACPAMQRPWKGRGPGPGGGCEHQRFRPPTCGLRWAERQHQHQQRQPTTRWAERHHVAVRGGRKRSRPATLDSRASSRLYETD